MIIYNVMMKQLVDIKLHDSLPLFPILTTNLVQNPATCTPTIQTSAATATATNLHQNKNSWWARTEDRDSRSSRLKSYYVDLKKYVSTIIMYNSILHTWMWLQPSFFLILHFAFMGHPKMIWIKVKRITVKK